MIPVFNFRGYTAPDPIDRASTRSQFLLLFAVSAALGVPFLYVQAYVLHIVLYTTVWTFIVGSLIYTFLMGSILVVFRKSSSLLFWLLILIPASLIDIVRETYLRAHGVNLFWWYHPGNFISDIATPWRFFVAWSFDGVYSGILALYVARLVASVIFPASNAKSIPTVEQQRAAFPDKWSDEPVKKPVRGGGFWALRIIGLIYFIYLGFLVVGLFGVSPWPQQVQDLFNMTFTNQALGINTFAKLGLMGLLGFIGAYNVNVRWHSTLVMLCGHAASTLASLALYFYNTPPPANPLYRTMLMASAIVDTIMSAIFIWILITEREKAKEFAPEKDFPDFFSLADTLNRMLFYVIGAFALLMIPVAILFRVKGDAITVHFGLPLWREIMGGFSAVFGYPDPQLSNTITMLTTISALAFLMARRIKLRNYLFGVLLFGLVVAASGELVWGFLASLFGLGITTRSGAVLNVDWYFGIAALIDGLAAAALLGARKMYYDLDYSVNALNPSSAQNAMAVHNAIFDCSPEESALVLQRIDDHVAGVRGRKRGLLNFPFWLLEQVFSGLFGLHPKFSTMSRDEQQYFLRYYIMRTPRECARSFVPLIAELAYQLGTASHAFATLAHYTTPKGWEETGYIPPDARDRLQKDHPTERPPLKGPAPLPDSVDSPYNFKQPSPPDSKPLVAPRVSTPFRQADIPDDVDYLIIGSGAGGACMAYRLATEVKDPSRILVVERGPRYSPLQDFNDDEMAMVRKLYKEGGLQQSKRFDLVVMQGECLGGTTVINNAICFEMPELIRNTWQNDYGLDLSNLDTEYKAVERELEISPIPSFAINALVEDRFVAGVNGVNAQLPADQQLKLDRPLKANQRNMIGDGCDNLGNKRLRKRSMLETYLPWSEARGVKIVADVSAVRFTTDSAGKRAESVLLRDNIGNLRKVKVRKAVIVAGGVIASSHFLMRSDLKGMVGRGLSCNFALPVAAEFPDILDAFDGTQMTLGALDPQNRAIFETYANLPGTFAISLPFYFDRLRNSMNGFRKLTNFAALVGSEPNGVLERYADPVSGRPFTWEIGARDAANIKYAFTTLLEISRAAGATSGILPTTPGLQIPLSSGTELAEFRKNIESYPLRMSDLKLLTAHPQGGNRMIAGTSKHAGERVVDENFRVAGFDNVFVADASLFPTGITVNPQWTIMAMSSLASKQVLKQ
ncbi:MAG: hypothetical protein QOK37_4751 [Thermoanaerobaculia bacterium]|jgi:choline dehydrogenase-like flavoprotein|nr:hypothetical protein [Thermoanaerobaculia bacterium]